MRYRYGKDFDSPTNKKSLRALWEQIWSSNGIH